MIGAKDRYCDESLPKNPSCSIAIKLPASSSAIQFCVADQVISIGSGLDNVMQGKICLITGATSGIGWITACELAKMGACVVLVGRDKVRGAKAMERIREKSGESKIEFLQADLSILNEVRRLAEQFCAIHSRLDVLVNNAGTVLLTRKLTEDGFEITFAVNHLAPFLLTNLLLDVLKSSAPSRVINVCSETHRKARIDFDNLQGERSYNSMRAYGQSKLANLLFTYELARRLNGHGVSANAVHPGFVATGLGRDNGPLVHFFIRLAMLAGISPEKGAETVLTLASSPEVEGITGKYFMDKKAVSSSALSYDLDLARHLWELSETMTAISNKSKG